MWIKPLSKKKVLGGWEVSWFLQDDSGQELFLSKKGKCYFYKEPWLKEICSKFPVITLSLDALLPKKGPCFLIDFDVCCQKSPEMDFDIY